MLRSKFRVIGLGVVLSIFLAAVTHADIYFVKPISEVTIQSEDTLPELSQFRWPGSVQNRQPYASIDGEGDVFVTPLPANQFGQQNSRVPNPQPRIAIRLKDRREVTGKLFLPKGRSEGMVALSFSIPAGEGTVELKAAFQDVKLSHYERLRNQDMPGAAWFRHQEQVLRTAKGSNRQNRRNRNFQRARDLGAAYSLVSGGMAVSENLQLDRLLPATAAEKSTVDIETIQGITIREFDWEDLIRGKQPERDELAKLIPNDQYAIFFPSFQAMATVADNAGEQGTLALRAAEPRAEDAMVRAKYERQLGLEMHAVARFVGPALVKSVALTGADPYLRTGADLAVLFNAKDVVKLRAFINLQISTAAKHYASAESHDGRVQGIDYTGFRSPDREICSYTATLGDAVVVTNSSSQLERIVQAWHGDIKSVNDLDEYTFFRARYPLGDKGESGLLILSDNTIRKWCGPRWRIATARRTRAAAFMADLQARRLHDLVGKKGLGESVTSAMPADVGEIVMGDTGIRSSVYGTLNFMTPIIEIDLDRVTESEKTSYIGWRTGYERNWTNFFDPIAIQFQATKTKLAADLTVMPLIDFSRYQSMVSVSQGATLQASSGDPHSESLLHAVLALNADSAMLRRGSSMISSVVNVNPLSWVGESVSMYVDEDPFWSECAEIEDETALQRFLTENAYRIPVGANIDVRNGPMLIAFLSGVRAFAQQSAPGMTLWENLKYRDVDYVKVSPSERAKSGNAWDNFALFYVPSGKQLILTGSEDLLKRAIDRQAERATTDTNTERNAAKVSGAEATKVQPWLGKNLGVTVDQRAVSFLHRAVGSMYQSRLRQMSWSNLAILNEWHQLYPNENPVKFHEQYWNRKLVCPGGGEYRWNESWQTMESTVYGHPGEPRMKATLPVTLQQIQSANFGLTFEENGLRARVELQRRGASGQNTQPTPKLP